MCGGVFFGAVSFLGGAFVLVDFGPFYFFEWSGAVAGVWFVLRDVLALTLSEGPVLVWFLSLGIFVVLYFGTVFLGS